MDDVRIYDQAISEAEMEYLFNNPGAQNFPPVAKFSFEPHSGFIPLQVQFTDSSLNQPTSWKWYFGDGDSSDVQNPQHEYDSVGVYYPILHVSNDYGQDSLISTDPIVVDSQLVVDFTIDTTYGPINLEVHFTPSSSLPLDSAWWDYGDDSTGTENSHTYTTIDTFDVRYVYYYDQIIDTVLKEDAIITTVPYTEFIATGAKGKAPLTVTFMFD